MPMAILRGVRPLALLGTLFLSLNSAGAQAQADGQADTRQGASTAQPAVPDAQKSAAVAENAACDNGDMNACNALGHAYHDGRGVMQNRPVAAVLFDQACTGGVIDACGSLALMLHENDGILDNAAQSLSLAKQACDKGNSDGCLALGEIYIDRGPSDDRYADGWKFIDRLCREENRRDACKVAVSAYDESDKSLQYQYNYHGCAGLIASACLQAAEMAEAGTGTPANHEAALALSRRGHYVLEQECAAGLDRSCSTLAGDLADGGIEPVDKARAAQIYSELCGKGILSACQDRDELAAFVPDLPIPQAGENWKSPDADPGVWQTPARYGKTEPPVRTGCHDNVAQFRGVTYTDTICPSAPMKRSINGHAIKPGAAPWQALLWRPAERAFSLQAQMLCGGALIAKGWVLTAAHCVKDGKTWISSGGYEVRLGVYNPQDVTQGVSYPIENVFPYPDYDKDKHAYDIALVQYDPRKWKQVGQTNAIRTIALDREPITGRRFPKSANAYAYGWGWTAAIRSQSTDNLRSVQLQVDRPSTCSDYTRRAQLSLGDIVLCAKGRDGRQVCKGDSGGPLVYYQDPDDVPKLIGVVNATWGCGTTEGYDKGLFARVAAPQIKAWIESHVGRGPRQPPPRERR